jgi:hypothetical protein
LDRAHVGIPRLPNRRPASQFLRVNHASFGITDRRQAGSAYFSGSFFFCFAKKMQIAKSTLILGSIREFRASKNFPEILPGPFTYIYSKNGPDEYGI